MSEQVIVPDKMVPHNVEAEQAVLGALLIDPDAIFKVNTFLRDEDFYVERHQWIYDAISSLHERREAVDFVTLCDELERRERLAELGGAAYLTALINSTPTALNIEHYGRIVERTSTLRRLIGAAGEIAALAYQDTDDVDEVVDRAEQVLFGVSQRRIARDVRPIRDVVSEYYDRIDYLYQHKGETIGVPTGFRQLDKILGGMQDSDLIIVAARPSMGKTSLMLAFALNAARKYNQRVAFFSLEMSAEQLVQRLVSSETGIDSQRLRIGTLREEEWPTFIQATGALSETMMFIDDTPSISAMQVRTKARRLYAEYGLDLLVIDYLQLMQSDRHSENRVQEISFLSRALKGLARELNIPVVVGSQLSRAVEQRNDKRPMLSDLRESGCLAGDSLVQMADGRRVPIRELVDGTQPIEVMAVNEETWRLERTLARKAWKTGTRLVFTLETQLGQVIRATANHRFLTLDGWKRLDELDVGQHVVLPRSWKGLHTSKAGLTNAEAALLGHLIGDGCTLPRHAVQYTTMQRELAEAVAGLATQVFGEAVVPRIERERSWWQVYLSASEHLTHGKRNPIARWLDDLGVWGRRSHEKRVPDAMYVQPVETICCFLKHLWSTDGTLGVFGRKKPRALAYYASSSWELARDVQHLLRRLGIVARLHMILQEGKGRDQWHVTVSGKPDLLSFIDQVGVVGPKQAGLEAIQEFYAERPHNTNRDVIPSLAWRSIVEPARQAVGMTTREMQAAIDTHYCGTALYQSNMSRERALRVSAAVQSEPLERLATSDVYWDQVAAIEPSGIEDVYDLEVPQYHNFVANDIVVHNSIEQDSDIVMFIYRDEYYTPETEQPNIAEIIISKHRNGPTGMVPLFFRKELAQFLEVEMFREDLDF
ncbi:MAG: replicative DNA helicase [Anaerolineae bacterium]